MCQWRRCARSERPPPRNRGAAAGGATGTSRCRAVADKWRRNAATAKADQAEGGGTGVGGKGDERWEGTAGRGRRGRTAQRRRTPPHVVNSRPGPPERGEGQRAALGDPQWRDTRPARATGGGCGGEGEASRSSCHAGDWVGRLSGAGDSTSGSYVGRLKTPQLTPVGPAIQRGQGQHIPRAKPNATW